MSNSQVAKLTISSVVPESTKDDETLIVARWKNTDARPIAAANRARAVVIPSNLWSDDPSVRTMQSKELRLFLLDSIHELAKNYLSAIVEDSKWMRTEVPQEAFSLPSLLTWQAEQAAISGRLNGEEIRKWLASSITVTSIKTSHGEKVADALGSQLVKLASPNHGLTPEKAEKLLSSIWKQEDADSTTGLRVMLRLQAIRDKQQESENLLDSIL